MEERIYTDYISAMKTKNKPLVDFLSYIRSEMKNAAISAKKDKLQDDEVLMVFTKHKKRLQDTLAAIQSSGKQEAIDDAKREISLVETYLPKSMDEVELIKIIDQVIKDTGAASMKDMGKVMKEVSVKVGARAEASKISALVKGKLSGQ
jgi:uncharacterized protein YqeY